jgi:hypothetical protein
MSTTLTQAVGVQDGGQGLDGQQLVEYAEHGCSSTQDGRLALLDKARELAVGS